MGVIVYVRTRCGRTEEERIHDDGAVASTPFKLTPHATPVPCHVSLSSYVLHPIMTRAGVAVDSSSAQLALGTYDRNSFCVVSCVPAQGVSDWYTSEGRMLNGSLHRENQQCNVPWSK